MELVIATAAAELADATAVATEIDCEGTSVAVAGLPTDSSSSRADDFSNKDRGKVFMTLPYSGNVAFSPFWLFDRQLC